MLGLRLLGNGRGAIDEFPTPEPKDDEVLVRVKVSAICGTDLEGYRSSDDRKRGTGHEAVGIIEDPGNSSRFKKGDRVGILAVYGCGKCEYCKAGHYPYCQQQRPLPPFQMQFLTAPDFCCLPLPDDMPFDTAVVVTGCGIGVAYHASNRLNPKPGEAVLVVGAGPIGLSAVLTLKYIGAKVIATDLNSYRLELAKKLGADYTIEAGKENVIASLREVNSGRLADKAFMAATNEKAVLLALSGLREKGEVVLVGGAQFTIGTFSLAVGDKGMFGSWHFHADDYEDMLKIAKSGLPVEKLITHRFPYKDADEAFRLFAEGKAGKVVLLWE